MMLTLVTIAITAPPLLGFAVMLAMCRAGARPEPKQFPVPVLAVTVAGVQSSLAMQIDGKARESTIPGWPRDKKWTLAAGKLYGTQPRFIRLFPASNPHPRAGSFTTAVSAGYRI